MISHYVEPMNQMMDTGPKARFTVTWKTPSARWIWPLSSCRFKAGCTHIAYAAQAGGAPGQELRRFRPSDRSTVRRHGAAVARECVNHNA